MSSNSDSEVFRGKGSAYVLDNLTKQWNDRGTSGTIIMYDKSPHNNPINTNIATIKWVKNTHEVWWTLNGSKLKPKGERAWVMKATLLKPNTKEILALRFQTSEVAKQFASKYCEIFPNSVVNMLPYYRPPAPPPIHAPPLRPINSWQCQMCTLWNADSDSTCRACTWTKPITETSTDGEPNIDAFYEDEQKWACAVCTYTNSMDRQTCVMCGLPQGKSNYSTRIVTRYNNTRTEYQKQILDQETKTKLTVTGYCRNIEQLLNVNILNKQDVIIPSGVIHLCFMFYVNTPWDFILDILDILVKKEEFKLLCKLKKIAEYLLNKDVEKYRILPFTNSKFRNEILTYEGSLVFLHNLGFLLDTETNDRLICQQVRSNVIESCIETLTVKCKELKETIDTVQNTIQNHAQFPTAKWICPACTYQNNDYLSRCVICNSYKQPLANPYPPKDFVNTNYTWMCHMCAHDNDVSVERCVMCNSPKKRSSNQLAIGSSSSIFPQYQSKIEYKSIEDFENVASDIFHANSEPLSLFNTLKSVTRKLRRDDDKFRKLNLKNEKVHEKLLNFEGIYEFLMLLGFEPGPIGEFLICNDKPQVQLLDDADATILKYQLKLKIFKSKVNHDDIDDNIDEVKDEYDGKLTLDKLIHHGTDAETTGSDIMDMLVLTHKLFTTSLRFMKALRKRFIVNILNNDDENGQDVKNVLNARKRIHLKTIKTLKDWMRNYWVEDFIDNEELQKELNDWLKDMLIFQEMDEYNKDCDWVIKLHDAIKRELKTLKNKTFSNEEKREELDLSSMDKKHIRMLNNCSGEELADQITLMEEELFNKIKAREWLHSGRITNNYKHAPHLQKVMERNKMLTYFVISKILSENNLKNRAKIIKRFIRVGEQLKDVHNYQSLGAVFEALNNACIHRLKRAWFRVPDKWKDKFDQWKCLFDKENNYKNMRHTMRIVMRSGNKTCIPYVNMLINYFYVSQPTFKTNDINECYNDPSVLKEREVIMYIRQTDKIKQIQQDQKIRYDSLIKPNIALQTVLLNEFAKCNVLDEDILWDMSTEIKKKDNIEYSKPVVF